MLVWSGVCQVSREHHREILNPTAVRRCCDWPVPRRVGLRLFHHPRAIASRASESFLENLAERSHCLPACVLACVRRQGCPSQPRVTTEEHHSQSQSQSQSRNYRSGSTVEGIGHRRRLFAPPAGEPMRTDPSARCGLAAVLSFVPLHVFLSSRRKTSSFSVMKNAENNNNFQLQKQWYDHFFRPPRSMAIIITSHGMQTQWMMLCCYHGPFLSRVPFLCGAFLEKGHRL